MKLALYGLSNDTYHNSPEYAEYISSTELKDYMVSPKYFKYKQDHPDGEQTDAMKFGSLFHELMECLAKCKGRWDDGFNTFFNKIAVFEPPINDLTGKPYGIATKVYKDEYATFLEHSSNIGKEVVTREDVELVSEMAHSLLWRCGTTSEQIRKILNWTKDTECSFLYENKEGAKLKIRPDALTRDKLIDWKTCNLESLDEESIAKQIIKYRYDVSLSMYQQVLHECLNEWYTPFLVFVSKVAPYESVICDMSDWCYSYDRKFDIIMPGVGAMEYERLLKLHTECISANEWQGIEHTLSECDNKIMKPTIPYWFSKKYDEQ